MRSGAVGINLTAANHVFILEPAMNPALEDQAVGRAFRMGQQRPVVVKKLYIKVLLPAGAAHSLDASSVLGHDPLLHASRLSQASSHA